MTDIGTPLKERRVIPLTEPIPGQKDPILPPPVKTPVKEPVR